LHTIGSDGEIEDLEEAVPCAVVVRVTPIAASVTVTMEPDTAAPEESTTVPLTAPRVCWAPAQGAQIAMLIRGKVRYVLRKIGDSPEIEMQDSGPNYSLELNHELCSSMDDSILE